MDTHNRENLDRGACFFKREQSRRDAGEEAAAVNGVRQAWKHLLLPQELQPGSNGVERGFDLETVALTNRARYPEPSAQLAWKKCEADGLIVWRLGVLDNDLSKVWQPDHPHVAVRQLRDWFAQFSYLSKLREPQVLAKAISEALARSCAKYALADRFDVTNGEYVGLQVGRLVEVNLNSDMVLVRRETAEAHLAKNASPQTLREDENLGPGSRPTQDAQLRQPAKRRRPHRFYAKVALDPNRPTPQVSNIAQSILSELDRVRGTRLI